MLGSQPPYPELWNLLLEGKVIPVLGPGVARAGKSGPAWNAEKATRPPQPDELARYLANLVTFSGEGLENMAQLATVAMYYGLMTNRSRLRERMRQVYSQSYQVGPLHELLADVPKPVLVVSTTYDDLLEQAFRAKGKPFDLVVYPTDNKKLAATLMYWKHGEAKPQYVPPKELLINLKDDSVIFKIHGGVDQTDPSRDSFVVAEDDYTDFLERVGKRTALPAFCGEPFRTRHFLFLGYELDDWHSRVVLRKIEKELPRVEEEDLRTWVIQETPTPLEQALWKKRGAALFDMSITEFVHGVRQSIAPAPLPAAEGEGPEDELPSAAGWDYAYGLQQLAERLKDKDATWREQFLTLEARLRDNLNAELLYGPDDTTRRTRSEIVYSLNWLAQRAQLGVSFNELCRKPVVE